MKDDSKAAWCRCRDRECHWGQEGRADSGQRYTDGPLKDKKESTK